MFIVIGITGVVVGGVLSTLHEIVFTVDIEEGKVYDYEGRELDEYGYPTSWPTWRRVLQSLVPQAAYSNIEWILWIEFFGGIAAIVYGSKLVRKRKIVR